MKRDICSSDGIIHLNGGVDVVHAKTSSFEWIFDQFATCYTLLNAISSSYSFIVASETPRIVRTHLNAISGSYSFIVASETPRIVRAQ